MTESLTNVNKMVCVFDFWIFVILLKANGFFLQLTYSKDAEPIARAFS